MTEIGADCVRVDFFSAIQDTHFIAHVFTSDEAMALAKAITTAALNCRPIAAKARAMAKAQTALEEAKRKR